MKYRNRVRSRISNLKDPKNPGLRRNVLCGAIEPSLIARMTAEVGCMGLVPMDVIHAASLVPKSWVLALWVLSTVGLSQHLPVPLNEARGALEKSWQHCRVPSELCRPPAHHRSGCRMSHWQESGWSVLICPPQPGSTNQAPQKPSFPCGETDLCRQQF